MALDNEKASPLWAIEVQDLTKSFGNNPALRGIDFQVKQGESVVVFGPNGAGKTTLIKLLANSMNPTSGKILINGMSLKDNAEKVRRQIGVITHQTFLYNHLTAQENLDFYGRMYDIPQRRERIDEVVKLVGMKSRFNDRVGTLSRGMQQRLSIARCLLHKPSIVLLDEPETGLDQQSTAMLWQALRAEGENPTIVLTTHNLERGLALCERMLILARGGIAYQGSTCTLRLDELKQTYQNCTRVEA